MPGTFLEQFRLVRGANLNSASDISTAGFSPSYYPVIIRAVSISLNNALTNQLVVKFDKRPTFGSDTNRGDGDVAVVTIASADGTAGRTCFKDGLNVRITPGQEVIPEVTDAAGGACTGDVFILFEYDPETPANFATTMTESST